MRSVALLFALLVTALAAAGQDGQPPAWAGLAGTWKLDRKASSNEMKTFLPKDKDMVWKVTVDDSR